MINDQLVYEFREDDSRDVMTFFFISKGDTDIIKAVQYSFLVDLHGRHLYNLGFGDYDLESDSIRDDINSNNNDVYKVLNTVLCTIPLFFEKHKNASLIITGSDGNDDFKDQCRSNCTKRCINECKNFNRRIILYTLYVDKNYEILCTDYQFFGGVKNQSGNVIFCDYKKGEKYDAVLLLNKNH